MQVPDYIHSQIETVAGWTLDPRAFGTDLLSIYHSVESAKGHIDQVIENLTDKIDYLQEVKDSL